MSQQSRYNVAEYDSEEERSRDPDGPPLENQSIAAAYVASKIQSIRGMYALMGGFALVLMGSNRSTRDVDMVTNLSMAQIWSLIEGDPRLIVPNSKITADVIKIFVKTGPGYDECRLRKDVEVDIALPGVKGTPRDITNATANVRGGRITIGGRATNPTLSSLDVPFILKAKMYHYSDRGFDRDLQDIIFLLNTYGDRVAQGRRFLKPEDIEAFLESEDLDDDLKERFGKILGIVN